MIANFGATSASNPLLHHTRGGLDIGGFLSRDGVLSGTLESFILADRFARARRYGVDVRGDGLLDASRSCRSVVKRFYWNLYLSRTGT